MNAETAITQLHHPVMKGMQPRETLQNKCGIVAEQQYNLEGSIDNRRVESTLMEQGPLTKSIKRIKTNLSLCLRVIDVRFQKYALNESKNRSHSSGDAISSTDISYLRRLVLLISCCIYPPGKYSPCPYNWTQNTYTSASLSPHLPSLNRLSAT